MKAAFSRYWLLGLFILFISWVIIAADSGTIPPAIRALYRFPGGDWVGHFVLYGILAWLSVRAFPRRVTILGRSFPLAAFFVILLAALEELSQFWFPLRSADWRDLAFGVLGITLGSWLAKRNS
jgi:hypothetical protein